MIILRLLAAIACRERRDRRARDRDIVPFDHEADRIVGDCEQVVKDYCDRACRALDVMPECEARRSLTDLAEYVRERRS